MGVIFRPSEAQQLFATLQAAPMARVDVLGGGRGALESANKTFGLALAADDTARLRVVVDQVAGLTDVRALALHAAHCR